MRRLDLGHHAYSNCPSYATPVSDWLSRREAGSAQAAARSLALFKKRPDPSTAQMLCVAEAPYVHEQAPKGVDDRYSGGVAARKRRTSVLEWGQPGGPLSRPTTSPDSSLRLLTGVAAHNLAPPTIDSGDTHAE